MAFMIPVMKNNYDIYNGGRTRKISETTRSECQSLSTSPSSGNNEYVSSPQHHRHNFQRSLSSKPISRNYSKTSQDSFGMSPTRLSLQTTCSSTSPPKSANNTNSSQSSLSSKFSARVMVDKLRRTLSLTRKGNSSTDRS